MWLLLLFLIPTFGRSILYGNLSQAITDRITSEDELNYLILDDPLGIRIYQYPRGYIWYSGTIYDQHIHSPILIMQSDGNLVLYEQVSTLFSIGSSAEVAISVHLNADGTLLQSGDGSVLWTSSGSAGNLPDGSSPESTLDPRNHMAIYNFMEPSSLTNGNYKLMMDVNRMFISRNQTTVAWVKNFYSQSSKAIAWVHPDGEFFGASLEKRWESGTTNLDGQYNNLQFIGNGVLAIISTNGTIMWRSDQYVRPIYTTATSTSSSASSSTYYWPTYSTIWTPSWGYTWGSWGGSWGSSGIIVSNNMGSKGLTLNTMMAIIVSVSTIVGFIALVLIIVIGIIMIRRSRTTVDKTGLLYNQVLEDTE